MVNAMFAVLIAGSIGYVLSGWAGMAVGAMVASVVAVLTEALTPPIERGTSHERRMRANWHYRARYEALEDGWRRPYPRHRRAWQPAIQPARETRALAELTPVDPVPVALDELEPAAPLLDHSEPRQLPAGSKAPGRRARAQTSSRSAAAPSASGKSDSSPRRKESGRHKRAVEASPRPRRGPQPA